MQPAPSAQSELLHTDDEPYLCSSYFFTRSSEWCLCMNLIIPSVLVLCGFAWQQAQCLIQPQIPVHFRALALVASSWIWRVAVKAQMVWNALSVATNDENGSSEDLVWRLTAKHLVVLSDYAQDSIEEWTSHSGNTLCKVRSICICTWLNLLVSTHKKVFRNDRRTVQKVRSTCIFICICKWLNLEAR